MKNNSKRKAMEFAMANPKLQQRRTKKRNDYTGFVAE